ncbi:MAG: DUF3168 domain-containing protein [Gemmatimonadaceae bacterium]
MTSPTARDPRSFAWPVEVALAAAIETDATLATLLAGGKVYSLVAPPKSPFDYITLGDMSESASSHFNRFGTSSVETIHIWSRKPGKSGVLAIYMALYVLLHGRALPLAGTASMLRGTLILATVLADPDGLTAHGVARYAVRAEAVT